MTIRLILSLTVLLIIGICAQKENEQASGRALQQFSTSTSDMDPSPDVWIVELKAGTTSVSSVASDMVASASNGKVGFVFQQALQGFVYHGSDIDAIKADPNVKSVTRDGLSYIVGTSTTMSQKVPSGIQRIFADTKTYMRQASSTCRCDAVVAVLDTGVSFSHPDLLVNQQMSVDCTSGTCVQGFGDDDNGHGSHVAGTIAAISNAQGVIGVCPGAEIWSVKVIGSAGWGYNSWILAGIEYIRTYASRVDVINMSIAGDGCDSNYCAAIARTKRAGVAFAVAAGNDNSQASSVTPACCAGVLAVSALSDSDGEAGGAGGNTCTGNKDDMIASFSNYGSAVDMAAPGDCILSTVPGGYAYYSGTSMASPHVAGALAVIASNNHNGRVNRHYRKLKAAGNYNFIDKSVDTFKEPLLDMTRIRDAHMIGSCSSLLAGAVIQEDVDFGSDRRLQQQDDGDEDRWIVELYPQQQNFLRTAAEAMDTTSQAIEMTEEIDGHVGLVFEQVLDGFVYHGKDIDSIEANPNVKSVRRDYKIEASVQTVPTGIKRVYADTKNYTRAASSRCFCDAVVAILDTGVDFSHPDLRVNKVKSVDCSGNRRSTQPACILGRGDDDNGHGTHVAGTAGAIANRVGVIGVCPGAEIWSIKMLDSSGSGYSSWALAALDYVAQNAAAIDVANLSWGYYKEGFCDDLLCRGMARVKKAGVAMAVAAGNYNSPAQNQSPACCSAGLAVASLSDADGTPGGQGTSSCKTYPDDTIAGSSNYGDAVDIVAPGDCILSTVPGGYAVYSGTSMASPHVAGALAVVASTRNNKRVNPLYRKVKRAGNFDYSDKPPFFRKKPLLDLRKLPDANMIGRCRRK
ncbi:hypothetical protein MPSEU_000264100 [Mayamaea pseudoterrestris]|nr:hypothetical protein MPSEU_000264100 [Mayamaea pseudoterrestris]